MVDQKACENRIAAQGGVEEDEVVTGVYEVVVGHHGKEVGTVVYQGRTEALV